MDDINRLLEGEINAGGKMKEKEKRIEESQYGATNSSGFTALPRVSLLNGAFSDIGNYGNWWSSTENNTTNA
jgi:uncharacterized protein (TIGR02145 family)